MKKITLLLLFFTLTNIVSQTSIKKEHTLKQNSSVIYTYDNTTNYYEADNVATFSKCEKEKTTNLEKSNCFITNLMIYTVDELQKSNTIKNSNFKSGTKKTRILFIIDEQGKIHVTKILGNWPKNFIKNISNILEATPNIIPATKSGEKIPVKFSIKIPFYVK